MNLNEADTRAKLLDPALHSRGWTEERILREESPGPIQIVGGKARQGHKRIDYLLRVPAPGGGQPVAVAMVEAKREGKPPTDGMEQVKAYSDQSRRYNVVAVFSTNGRLFVEYDRATNTVHPPRPLSDFPTPAELQARYEAYVGFALADPAARPLLTPYTGGEGIRRYYQDAAIRAVLEQIARSRVDGSPPRALLSLATGAGKTLIAAHLLKRLADAGELRRALFVCDRDELRWQALGMFQHLFGTDVAVIGSGRPEKNARVLIATYQTLDVENEEGTASFLREHYPPDYFTHIVIDECHRSAWGKWSEVLRRNSHAVQVGLTATPRQLAGLGRSPEAEADDRITADNVAYFGEPVYEYDLSQGIEDGYLAACEIIQREVVLDSAPAGERVLGVDRPDLAGKSLTDARTGDPLTVAEAREHYAAGSFEDDLILPERVAAMCTDLFGQFLATGGPEQKTIIFCARDSHADRVAGELTNLYSAWCRREGRAPAHQYAFKCTAAGGSDQLADLRDSARTHFIAATVDLLTTGVDVPEVRNVVFFRYVRSPIAFYQMLGRGTRITFDKRMFRVYDYTDATRLFGEAFLTYIAPPRADGTDPPVLDDADPAAAPDRRIIEAHGFLVEIGDSGRWIVTQDEDGKAIRLAWDDYKARLAARLRAEAADPPALRARWVDPAARQALLASLPDGPRAAYLVQTVENMEGYDLFDVLALVGYNTPPQTRSARAASFPRREAAWLAGLPAPAGGAVRAMLGQFVQEGVEGLESRHIFQTPPVQAAGGLAALGPQPGPIIQETKARLFAV